MAASSHMAASGQDRLIAVGVFGAPHGVRGELRLKSYTGDPLAIADYAPLRDATGRVFVITGARLVRDDMLVVRLEGVNDRDGAQALTNRELFVPRHQLPPPGAEEFYHADLVGLAALTQDGAPFGKVQAVLNFGAGDILEIAPAAGGETILLPFTRAAVPELDFPGGRIIVVPPREIEEEGAP